MVERICSVDGCDRRGSHRGWCTTHYGRWRLTGSTDEPRLINAGRCAIDDCPNLAKSRGWCDLHYSRWHRTGSPTGIRPNYRPLNAGNNFSRIWYVTCAWKPCGRLFVGSRRRQEKFCSKSCGQLNRYNKVRIARRAINTGAAHDTELCAWWEPPYCGLIAFKRDLCSIHYRRSREAGGLPPVAARRGIKHVLTNVQTGPTGPVAASCAECGPITAVRRGVRDGKMFFACKQADRANVLWRMYRLTQEQYDLRLIELGNRCALCRGRPGKVGLVVDHCHVKGHPRDLVCMPCNVLMGHIESRMDVLAAAHVYLNVHATSGVFASQAVAP